MRDTAVWFVLRVRGHRFSTDWQNGDEKYKVERLGGRIATWQPRCNLPCYRPEYIPLGHA
ncbi:hypothetical protein LZ31DRAFT_557862 [Colletotrichum somersetense]|nr:hypothetical protein LZ31DRAFT_557862 [Colletotrichum somersetense]